MARRTLIASGVIAPAVGALWAALVLTTTFGIMSDFGPDVMIATFAVTLVYAALFGLVLTWTVGLAWHVTAQRFGLRSFAAYAAAGVASGLAVSLIATSLLPAPASTGAFMIVYLSSCALVVSAVGWFIRRPDRDAANPAKASP